MTLPAAVPSELAIQAEAVVGPLIPRLVGLEGVQAPVIVGCSGGPDSLTLLIVATVCGLRPIAVHVDHGLRSGSEEEAAVVAEFAANLGVGVRSEEAIVTPGPNLEARARVARYGALHQTRRALDAQAVLVGHTADDQAETVLLNVLRGSASAGLGGMPVRRDFVVRPLLGVRRDETEAVCAELGLEPVRDPTNRDLLLRRNWIRHVVLPLLSEGAERDLVPVLARQAAILREESEYLDAQALAAWSAESPRSASSLAGLPTVLARRAVRGWLGPPPPSFDEIERVLTVARGEVKATELSGGRRLWRRFGRLHLESG